MVVTDCFVNSENVYQVAIHAGCYTKLTTTLLFILQLDHRWGGGTGITYWWMLKHVYSNAFAHLCSLITDTDFCDCSERTKEQFLQVIHTGKVWQSFDEFVSNLLKCWEESSLLVFPKVVLAVLRAFRKKRSGVK